MVRQRKLLLGREGKPELHQSMWAEILGSELSSLGKALKREHLSTSLIEVCEVCQLNAERIATFEAAGVSGNCTASPGSNRLEKPAKETAKRALKHR
ncbi:hypothetical protein E4U60_000528 [Claviceps pazoutovae]|uniref:Uncharacterized protein n=1 Tax=Claviceps pazoutovae TaxID=1649127 RepID=A0A9P7ME55_9HYPO|nr:hypothetical protein E4U60_000528 [Claviceps pazoutovae]